MTRLTRFAVLRFFWGTTCLSLLGGFSSEIVAGTEIEECGASATVADEATADGTPQIAVPNFTFDFGTMEPYEIRQHTFTIRNDGDAPLTLQAGQTSCKCTIGKLADGTISPGEESTVTLTWSSVAANKFFSHQAEILSNDPLTPVTVVTVRGEILSNLRADPETFSLPGIYPGEVTTSTVTMSSQLWEGFRIQNVRTSLEGMTWNIEPLDQVTRKTLDVQAGYRITIRLPTGLKQGYFQHWLRMQITPEGGIARQFELPILGTVLPRLSIYGEGSNASGIKIGKIHAGEGLKRYFVVKLRDRDPRLEVDTIKSHPEFLKLSFEENKKVKQPGSYRMCLEIPPSAPPSDFMENPGMIRVKFKHPRLEELHLNVEFAIVAQSDS